MRQILYSSIDASIVTQDSRDTFPIFFAIIAIIALRGIIDKFPLQGLSNALMILIPTLIALIALIALRIAYKAANILSIANYYTHNVLRP